MLALIAAAAQPMVPSDIQTVTTLDGWTLPLRHYAGAGRPVLLVHGLGVNHYNFDWRPDVSLAWWLQVRGWDVWVTTLRGDDGTVPPDPKTRSWTFEDHARKDLPAVVDTILARTGAAQLDWVGHSMGGMLLYAALSEIPEKIGSGVAICSPARFREITRLQRAGRGLRFLVAGAGRLRIRALRPSMRTLERGDPMVQVLSNPANMAPDVAKGLMADAATDVPNAVGREVFRWLDRGILDDATGRDWVQPVDVPLLVMGGSVDRFVPWQNAAAACEIYPRCTFRLLGTASGLSVEYGHVDPTIGRTAEAEIYPMIGAFLGHP